MALSLDVNAALLSKPIRPSPRYLVSPGFFHFFAVPAGRFNVLWARLGITVISLLGWLRPRDSNAYLFMPIEQSDFRLVLRRVRF